MAGRIFVPNERRATLRKYPAAGLSAGRSALRPHYPNRMETSSPEEARTKYRREQDDELQLVIRNAHDYREVATYRLTPRNVYIATATVFLVMALLIGALIAFTPLRTYIPGYGDVVQRQEVDELETTLTELTELVGAQELYIENLRRTVLGEATTIDSLDRSDTTSVSALDRTPLPPSEAEIRLRREMEEVRNGPSGDGEPGESTSLPVNGKRSTPLAQVYLVAPVNGEVSAGFNLIAGHLGVDVVAPRNTAIKATRDGVVFMAEFTNSFGNVIGIQHDNNLISFYKHNSELLKEVGDRVRAGEAIAIIGDTGTQTTGPHLHFELWQEGRAVDPGEYVGF